jgi:hypothetical protein
MKQNKQDKNSQTTTTTKLTQLTNMFKWIVHLYYWCWLEEKKGKRKKKSRKTY